MTVHQSKSPADLNFSPRRLTFDLAGSLAHDWHGGSPFRTAWYNALSMMFPIGEKLFIDSVIAFRNEIDDPRLLREIRAFQGQESNHLQQHQKFNELLCEVRGYDLEKIEAPMRKRLAWVNSKLSPMQRLAGTAANEHLTAVMVDDMLQRKDTFVGAEPKVAELWYWHGIEETEHKSVAFDVYEAVGGTLKERRRVLMFGSIFFLQGTFRVQRLMLRHDGKLWDLRDFFKGLYFLFIKPGILRRITFPYFRFLRKDFHPWENDNRHLIDEWEAEHSGRAEVGSDEN